MLLIVTQIVSVAKYFTTLYKIATYSFNAIFNYKRIDVAQKRLESKYN